MQATLRVFGIVALGLSVTSISRAGDLIDGSWQRPACGKVCKLVCETQKLSAIGFGYECDTVCIAGPSRPGCKHCDTTCCGGGDIKGCPPKIEFCWYDWFACGCATPRTVKVLSKYQAEKEIGWYQWEVVDAACCDCVTDVGRPARDRCIYKPAPVDAELGEILAISEEEWSELASALRTQEEQNSSQVAVQSPSRAEDDSNTPDAKAKTISIAERLGRLFK